MGIKLDVIVVGAGFGGLTTSIALAEYGHKVTILERNPTLSPWGGTVVLGPQISKALERYGMLAEFQTVAGGFSQASCHRRWKTGEIIVRSPAQGTDKTFGYRWITGKRSDYQQVLYKHAKQRGVSFRFSCPVQKVDAKAASVTSTNGEVLKADLVIAADGIKSAIRDDLFPGENKLYGGLDDYLGSVPLSEFQKDSSISYLVDDINFWWGPDGCVVMTIGGVGEDRCCFLEYCHVGDVGDEGNWSKEANMDELRELFSGWDPALRNILNKHVQRAKVLRLAYTNPELPWHIKDSKVLLIGDAAHAVLPHTGSGAALSMEDGFALAECLNRVTSYSSIPDILQAFEAIRKPRANFVNGFGIMMKNERQLPDGPEQEAADERLKDFLSIVPPDWDGKHIDDPPFANPELVPAFLGGYDVFDHTNRKLDEILGSLTKE